MRLFLKIAGILLIAMVVSVVAVVLLMPWMDGWGASAHEIRTSLPGDELVPSPRYVYNRAVTVDATPEQIYPWLVQMGAEKGGLYSYSWFETNVLRCELINADRIHEEWQDLKVGDKVKMCPGTSGPPAYEVALLDPNQAIVLGHQENGQWSDVWQFALRPQEDGTTRFLIRGRSTLTGMLWDIIRPGEFIMMRGMMLGIKERAEEIKQGRQAAPVVTVEPATPTPEIFNPLNPSPTPSDSTVPMTCQITDLNVYISEEWGYCFAYPAKYTLDESRASEGIISLSGPALEDNPDPIRVSLEVTTKLVPENSILSSLVDAYLGTFSNVILPMPISRESLNLGNEPAEKIDPIPGLLSSSLIMALHDTILFSLRFHPSDIDFAKPDLEELIQTITNTFAYLPGAVSPASGQQTITWSEFGKNISLSYDSALAPWVEAQMVPEVPVNGQILFSESHPAYVQFRFTGFQGGRNYALPLLPVENNVAQVMVFRTADFPGYGDNSPQGFVNQMQALKNILDGNIDPAHCEQSAPPEPALPFLPWVNSWQSLCSQPQIIQFPGGSGIRYLTYYAQGTSPLLDQQIFYTFQGLTADEQFYVVAFFPVQTGVFPTEAPPCPKCGQPDYNPLIEWQALVEQQLAQLNAQPADEFDPSLTTLDAIIQSIQITD